MTDRTDTDDLFVDFPDDLDAGNVPDLLSSFPTNLNAEDVPDLLGDFPDDLDAEDVPDMFQEFTDEVSPAEAAEINAMFPNMTAKAMRSLGAVNVADLDDMVTEEEFGEALKGSSLDPAVLDLDER